VTQVLEQPILFLLTLSCGIGVFCVAAGPVLGRRRVDLATRLRRLDPEVWWEEPPPDSTASHFLRPLGQDIARFLTGVVGRVGLISPKDLERTLSQARSELKPNEFYVEKLLTALGLEAVLLLTNVTFERLGLVQVGVWPLWFWVATAVVGFLAPDVIVRRRANEQRERLRAELPTLVDLLAVAVSTGRGVEDAVVDVTPFLAGPLADEWRKLQQRLPLGLPEALADLANQIGMPEFDILVGHLTTSYRRGQALGDNLIQLSETLRERRLHELTAAGGRATEKMFLPVVFLVLLPMLALVIAPAAASLAGVLEP
jgi:tight adherence protein C